jgi:hypothetical protein
MRLKDFIKMFESSPQSVTENKELQKRIFMALGHTNLLRDYVIELEEIIEKEGLRIPEQINKYIRGLEERYNVVIQEIQNQQRLEIKSKIEDTRTFGLIMDDYITIQRMYVPACEFVYAVKGKRRNVSSNDDR